MQRLLSCQHAKNADGWTNRQTDGFSTLYTIYAVYLANNKFGELGHNAHLQTF